jgi:FkbM family methyltransferase
MKFTFERDGDKYEFECFDTHLSRWICDDSLQGKSYPGIHFAGDINVVMDVGAYVGDASLFFSLEYPDAQVFAFEPAAAPYRLLEKNTRGRLNIHRFNYGLFSSDEEVPLYKGVVDPATASISKRSAETNTEETENVHLRSVSEWLNEQGIDAVDVVKIDTEGCELPILKEMYEHLSSIKIIHLEFHSEDDRKEIDRLLGDTHALVHGMMWFEVGTVTYVLRPRNDTAR